MIKGKGKNFMSKGKIRWFSLNRGYGFIKPLRGGEDVLVHISALNGGKRMIELHENDLVSYDVAESKGRTYAVNLHKLQES